MVEMHRRGMLLATLRLVVTALGGFAITGCATWRPQREVEKESSTPTSLRAYRMPSDSVIVEVALVDMPAEPELAAAIWMRLDETKIDAQHRGKLAANGFRIGVSPSVIPAEIESLLATQRELRDVDPETGAMAPGARGDQQRHQLRSGQTVQVATGPIADRMAWIVDEDGYRIGRSVSQAECQLAIRGYPRPDGTVRLRLTPEIYHGAATQGYGVADASLILRSSRNKETFNSLEMVADLSPGQMLVVGCVEGEDRLAHRFLADSQTTAERRRKLLLIRLAQTQLDDLFSTEQISQPLETVLE